MHVDAVLVVRVLVFEIVSEAECSGKFASGLLVEVSVGAACIDGIVADTEIGNPLLLISSGRQVAGQVSHEIIDAKIPTQRSHREQIANTGDRFSEAAPNRKSRTPQAQVAHTCCVDAALDSSIGYHKADVGLAAQNGRCKRVARYREIQWFGALVYVRIEVAVELHVDVAEGHLLRVRPVTAARHLAVIQNISEGKSGHQPRGCQTAEETRHPETHAACVSERTSGGGNNNGSSNWDCNSAGSQLQPNKRPPKLFS